MTTTLPVAAAASLPPAILIHLVLATGALVLGPLALAARKGQPLHRRTGYAWVLLMLGTALSSFFIRDFRLPNLAGYTPIHGLSVLTLIAVPAGVVLAMRGKVDRHRRVMRIAYASLVTAGLFTLVPRRFLGHLLWQELLGLPVGSAGAAAPSALPGGLPVSTFVLQALQHTPLWVWALLVGLVALGLSQVRGRSASLLRVSAMPVAMALFSAFGLVSAFGRSPQLSALLVVWLATAAVIARRLSTGASPARYDPASRRYTLPGSWLPLGLMVGVFLIKYVVGVALALQPQLIQHGPFALAVAALSGVFSGVFVGRAAKLWRLAAAPRAAQAVTA